MAYEAPRAGIRNRLNMMKQLYPFGLTILFMACAEGGGMNRDETIDVEARADLAKSQSSLGGECISTLEDVRDRGVSCPRRFDASGDVEAQLCGTVTAWIRVSTMEEFSILLYTYGAGGTICVYDGATADLVGVDVGDDSNYFCEGSSSSIRAGVIPESIDVASMTTVDCSE